MRYAPATVTALGIIVLIGFALHMTQNASYLWALLLLIIPAKMIP